MAPVLDPETDALPPCIKKVRSRIEPESGNDHFAEWLPAEEGGHYLGPSTLIKNPATYYAKRILQHRDSGFPGAAYMGWKGNCLADDAFTNYAWSEVQVRKDGHRDFADWPTIGHMDAVDLERIGVMGQTVHKVTGGEGKSHDYDGPKDHMLARRQLHVYLALLREQLEAGQRRFPLARWVWADPEVPEYADFPEGECVVSDAVCIFMGAHGKGATYIHDTVTDVELDAAMAWLEAKRSAILTSVEHGRQKYGTGPLDDEQVHEALGVDGGAYSWDRGPNGINEFQPIDDPDAPAPWHDHPDLDWDRIQQLAVAVEESKTVKNEAEAERKQAQSDILEMLATLDEDLEARPRKVECPDGTIVTVAGGWLGKKSPHINAKLPQRPVEVTTNGA